MSLHSFQRDALPVMPWKNGGGSTAEIACWPPGSGLADFGWRVSIAHIAAAGPFSVFEGIDRNIMLLEGDGVRLRSRDGQIDQLLQKPLQPFAFSGDAAIDCTLQGGASSDFNVMTRRSQWRADVQVLECAAAVAAAPHGVLLALRGSWSLGASGQRCDAGLGWCWTDADHGWQVAPQTSDAQLLVVCIRPAEAARHAAPAC